MTLRKYGSKYNTVFCTFCGLSTDTKPTKAMIDNRAVSLGNGSEFYEMDTDTKYSWDATSETWKEN